MCNVTRTAEAILTAALLVVVFSVIGFVLVIVGSGYGLTLFVVLPGLAGFVAGMTTRAMRPGLMAVGIGFAACLALLLVFSLEGLLCILAVSPLVATVAYAGVFLGRFASRGPGSHGGVVAVLIGLLIVGCSTFVEGRNPTAAHVVETVRDFPATPRQTWDAMLEFQQISGDKPWLLQLGLPVPKYCTIEGSGVGAIRTCHFDQGIIRERISVWEPPHRLVLAITEVTLPGRDWLQFIDASYELGATSSGETRVRRTTKLGSVLRPRFYWEPLEALATEVEHEYLLNALGTKLGNLLAVDPHATGMPPEQPAGLDS